MTQYAVWVFLPSEDHFKVADELDASAAVTAARKATGLPLPLSKIIITDADDMTCFEWQPGLGVTYP